jgi:hypothetical protein
MSSHDTKNPTGGVTMRHVMESPDPNDHLLERILLSVKELWVHPVEFPEGNPIQLG